MASRLEVYGGALLHPVVVVSLVLWGLNDHYGKGTWPGWLSGKLSDVTGLIVTPIVCAVSVEFLCALRGESVELARRRAYVVCVGSAVAVMTLMLGMNLWPPWADAYERGLGWAQWLISLPYHWALGHPITTPHRVSLTMDPTDLISLPAAVVGPLIYRKE